MFDPITEFDKALQAVNDFMDNHRIDPYTEDEISEIMKPKPK